MRKESKFAAKERCKKNKKIFPVLMKYSED